MWIRTAVAAFCLSTTTALAQDAPLSAIDWLSDSISTPVAAPAPEAEPPVTDSAAIGDITVTPLDDPDRVAVGLLPSSVTGLSPDLWGSSDALTIANLFLANHAAQTPAMQELLETLLLAELKAPLGGDPDGVLLQARVDTLLDTGRIAQALALIEIAGPKSPALVQRWLDAALLTGEENRVCETLIESNAITLTLPSRIFCLARGGDWNAAALTLGTARALGQLDETTEILLSRFLDPELYEDEPVVLPGRITPLIFRIVEAIGEPIPTSSLPRAFAVSDLEQRNGWKAQLDAVERLAASGAVAPNQLMGVYTQQLPSASGGVWDRVDAIQTLQTALSARDPNAVDEALPAAWDAMQASSLEVLFADVFAPSLASLPLSAQNARISVALAALSDQYETLVPKVADPALDAGLLALANGQQIPAPRTARDRALSAGFDEATPPPALMRFVQQGKTGEALLQALQTFENGMTGDPSQLADALRLFRTVGLEDVARRVALQAYVLGADTR